MPKNEAFACLIPGFRPPLAHSESRMIPRYKRKSIIGISGGCALSILGIVLARADIGLTTLGVICFFLGIPVYLWGCAALAHARGYSSALTLSAILVLWLPLVGLVIPLVVLLALPDKHSHHRRRDD